jgi:hypothetical protein
MIADFGRRDKSLIEALELIAEGLGPQHNVPPRDAHSTWREEVIIAYCVGTGKFSQDMEFINLQMDMFDLDGKWIGYQLGVHDSQSTLQELRTRPDPPQGPMDQPVGPVPHIPVMEWTKGVWTFADGSQVFAAGVAHSQLVSFTDGSFLFMVTTGQTITNGTGRYEGVHGTKQATGAALVPKEIVGHFPAPGLEFPAKTIEVFRLVKAEDIVEQPPAPLRPAEAARRARSRRT